MTFVFLESTKRETKYAAGPGFEPGTSGSKSDALLTALRGPAIRRPEDLLCEPSSEWVPALNKERIRRRGPFFLCYAQNTLDLLP